MNAKIRQQIERRKRRIARRLDRGVNAFRLGQLAYYQWPLGRAAAEG